MMHGFGMIVLLGPAIFVVGAVGYRYLTARTRLEEHYEWRIHD
jgi:hypothetical protein